MPRAMKIKGIEAYHCNTPFKNDYHSPHIVRIQAESIIIHIRVDGGISGYGESTPRAYVTGETPSSVAAVVRDHFAPFLLGEEITSVNDIERIVDMLEDTCRDYNISSYLSALGAVDIALLDGLSSNLGVPLSSLLGTIVRKNITYTVPIPLLPLDTIHEMSRYLTGTQFRAIKVLMEESVSNNMERLELIRSIFGPDMDLSIEANGKWAYQQAIDNLTHLKEFNIAAVEQPVSSGDVEGLRRIREITGIPVIVDESMCTVQDAELLIDSEACDILNIKISKCGGLLKSKHIADFALSRGICFQLGTHVGETDVLTRAGLALVQVSPNVLNFEGFSSLLFENGEDGTDQRDPMIFEHSIEPAHSGIDIGNHHLQMIFSLDL